MPLLDEFKNSYREKPTDPAKKILFGILSDLFGRKGFDDEWDAIEDEAKEEILAENLEIVKRSLL